MRWKQSFRVLKEPGRIVTSEETHTALINRFVTALNASNPGIEAAVVLAGSFARDAATAQSDLDLLIIAERDIKTPRAADRLHVQAMSERQFRERLENGDDYAAWCVRFGIPIVRAKVWERIVEAPDAKKWPDWRHKIDHAARRLLLASELMALGDIEAAGEELLYAVSHVARALLLKANVFPLSRPEMISQLTQTEYAELGTILEDFSYGRNGPSTMRRALLYTKKLLVHLDRTKYESYVRARQEARKQKNVQPRAKASKQT